MIDSTTNIYQQEMLAAIDNSFSYIYRGVIGGILGLLLIYLYLTRTTHSCWQGLVVAGFAQLIAVNLMLLPTVFSGYQQPVKEAAAIAHKLNIEQPATVVAWGESYPSFSVYYQAVVPNRLPQAGERVLVRVDKLAELQAQLTTKTLIPLYRHGGVALFAVE